MPEENSVKHDVQAQFGRNADNYVTSKIHAQGKDLRKLLDILNCNGEERVLDIATGGGHVANALAPLTQKVVALDLTKEILKAAERHVLSNGHDNVDFVKGDAEKLPFPDRTFDIVICRIAAHHFSDITAFIKESYRVMKKEGEFFLIDNVAPEKQEFDDFYNYLEKKRDYSHQRAWKKSEWIKSIEEQSFEINELYRFEKTFSFSKWCQMMNLSDDIQAFLAEYLLKAESRHKQKFRITEADGKPKTFQGEAILIKAVKSF
ncbi:class I SAM-dependent methyltransferase [Sediminibacillus massiliensis]|uniref:class I SAM-dependent methyltransferase n=1 Tax=Sediminibacillus massiliensis TaxID=1926277 RepID=UPI0009888BDD|nr:class I SAM-dependent methyltransferase [Sediminibacillus massiliensis]